MGERAWDEQATRMTYRLRELAQPGADLRALREGLKTEALQIQEQFQILNPDDWVPTSVPEVEAGRRLGLYARSAAAAAESLCATMDDARRKYDLCKDDCKSLRPDGGLVSGICDMAYASGKDIAECHCAPNTVLFAGTPEENLQGLPAEKTSPKQLLMCEVCMSRAEDEAVAVMEWGKELVMEWAKVLLSSETIAASNRDGQGP